MKPSKAVIAGAAVAGLLTGSLAVRAYAASTSGHAGVSLHTMADAQKPLPKHACKGQNDCKGQGLKNVLKIMPANPFNGFTEYGVPQWPYLPLGTLASAIALPTRR
jgi:hypothetical protein